MAQGQISLYTSLATPERLIDFCFPHQSSLADNDPRAFSERTELVYVNDRSYAEKRSVELFIIKRPARTLFPASDCAT
jgi:hypothetical protein